MKRWIAVFRIALCALACAATLADEKQPSSLPFLSIVTDSGELPGDEMLYFIYSTLLCLFCFFPFEKTVDDFVNGLRPLINGLSDCQRSYFATRQSGFFDGLICSQK